MDLIEYQRLVLMHALHIMACDGDVDSREVSEIRRMTADTPYFDELDVERELAVALERLSAGGARVIDAGFEELRRQEVTDRQRLRLLGVLLHMVHADEAVNEAERSYLQHVQAALGIPAEEVARHFPTRFSLFIAGAGKEFKSVPAFMMPAVLPVASDFL